MDESFSKKPKLMPSRARRIRYSLQLDVEAGMKERLEGWKSKIQRVTSPYASGQPFDDGTIC